MQELILIALSLTIVNCCRDGIDNVIALRDCEEESALVRFRNVKLLTYDNNKIPKCVGNEPNVALQGYLKMPSGEIIVSEDLFLNSAAAEILLTLQKSDIFINKVCKIGISSHFAMPRKHCKADLCSSLGAKFCDFIDKKGNHNLDQQPPSWHEFIRTDITDIFAQILLKGQWKGQIHIKQSGQVIGCLAVPANRRGWTRVNE